MASVLTIPPEREAAAEPTVSARLRALGWDGLGDSLDAFGYARTGPVLSPAECAALVALYRDERHFRSQVVMERHRFGVGDYKYFTRPLPPLVQELRAAAYPYLATVANRWAAWLGSDERYPARHELLVDACAARGQVRPTPLLLHYEAGGYNCLHQDLYGPLVFPLQVACVLSRPGVDFAGGEFLLVEQRPRAQSVAHVVAAEQGELILFTTRTRPVAGARGHFRVTVRHGVSRVHSGARYTLGVIFHDAA